jgi:hypothetical protein
MTSLSCARTQAQEAACTFLQYFTVIYRSELFHA